MSDIAIRVYELGKQYRIGRSQPRYQTFREALVQVASSPIRRLMGERQEENTIWALDDVSFEIRHGEAVGIIGRNGAGKSTLLKVLSRITKPTRGRVDLHGRVGSLLEVGTGFHPELTGRENIFLNGAILGMTRREIERKFDEIVDFSEIDRFLDTPVKHYSSGMYMRLAFSVAAHLEPEILLVDEVLAVGDAAFQKKSLGKMENVVDEGRTVLLVSHNMVAISQLCQQCMWIDSGIMRQMGTANEIVRDYMANQGKEALGFFDQRAIGGDGKISLISYQVNNNENNPLPLPLTNENILIKIKLKSVELISQPAIGVGIFNEQGILLTSINSVEQGVILPPMPAGDVEVTIRLIGVAYLPGRYTGTIWIMNPQGHIYIQADQAIKFEIGQSPIYGISQVDSRWGCVYTKVNFSFSAV